MSFWPSGEGLCPLWLSSGLHAVHNYRLDEQCWKVTGTPSFFSVRGTGIPWLFSSGWSVFKNIARSEATRQGSWCAWHAVVPNFASPPWQTLMIILLNPQSEHSYDQLQEGMDSLGGVKQLLQVPTASQWQTGAQKPGVTGFVASHIPSWHAQKIWVFPACSVRGGVQILYKTFIRDCLVEQRVSPSPCGTVHH